MKKIQPALFLSVLSGLLLTAGFPNLEWYPVSWVALVPLLFALRGRSAKEALGLGYVCGLAHFLTTLYWIYYVIQHYGGLPLPLAVGVLVLLCAYLAIYPACFALAAQRWQAHPLMGIFGLPSLWVTLEWVRAHALSGFPWANLGYTQTPFTWLAQVADLTGVYGVSWLVVLSSTTLMACLNGRRARTAVTAFCGALALVLAYGAWRLNQVEELQAKAPPFRVAVVQGNIDQSLKWNPEFQQETLKRYRELSLEAAGHNPEPDLVVWPETAAPFFYGIDEKLTAQLNGILKEIGEPLLFGSPAVTLDQGRPRLQNRAYLIEGEARIVGAYAKQHLVPFGEYVPLQKLLFFVRKLVEAAGDFMPGRDSTPFFLKDHRLGVLVCYEGIFPELARRTVRLGATSLVNITNDAWYGRTSAPYQHLEIARWRSIEFRVPLIRAANTGVSAIFDAAGKPCGTIALDEQGQLVCTVNPIDVKTFYAAWGDVFAWLCVFAAMGGLVYLEVKKR